MSHLDKQSVLLSEMLFFSQEFFWGSGSSSRFTISTITSLGMGSHLPWFLLMQDSKSQCRYTWQKPRESNKTKEKYIQLKAHCSEVTVNEISPYMMALVMKVKIHILCFNKKIRTICNKSWKCTSAVLYELYWPMLLKRENRVLILHLLASWYTSYLMLG